MNTQKTKVTKGWLAQAKTGIKSLGLALAATFAIQTATAGVAKIGATEYDSIAEAVTNADVGQTIDIFAEGTYTLPNIPKNITLKAADGVVYNCEGAGYSSICSIPNGCTFEGGVFNMGQTGYHGWQHAGHIIMNGCTLNGLFFSYGDMTFTGCHFVQTNAEYNMWTYAGNISYVDCDFTFKGKCINVYRESSTAYTVSFSGCTFTSDTKNKAAVNVKATCGNGAILSYTVNVTDCHVNDPAMFPAPASLNNGLLVIDGLVQVDDIDEAHQPDNTTVFLNGNPAYPAAKPAVAQIGETKYETLQAAVAAAQTGDTIVMTDDTTLTEAVKITKSVTIDTNGKAITAPDTVNGSAVNFHGALVASGEDVLVTIKGTGSISASLGAGKSGVLSAICAADGATVELEGVNVHGIAASGDNIVVYAYEDGVINVRGGNYLATGGGTCVSAYGSVAAEVNIYGGNFDAQGDKGPGCAWAAMEGVVNIYGGTFHADPLTNKTSPYEEEGAVYCLYDYRDMLGTSWEDYIGTLTVYGGTFRGFNPEGGNIGVNVNFVAAGYQAINNGDGTWTVGTVIKKGDGEQTVPALEQQSVSSVDEQKVDQIVADTEAKTAIKTETVVEGVKLTTTPKMSGETEISPAGMQAVVDAAKAKNPALAAALEQDTASMVSVRVDVAVSPVKYENETEAPQSVAAFKLTPKATVTVVNTTGTGTEAVTTSKSETVKVTNDMIDQTAVIAVTIYTGFKPAMLVHKDENGKVIETFTEGQFTYDEVKKTVTVPIHHFSTLEAVKVSYAAEAEGTVYETLAEAFNGVEAGKSATVKVLKDLTLDGEVTFASGKTATLDFAGRTITGGSITSAGALTLTGGTMNSALACDGGTMAITGGDYGVALPETTSTATNAGPFFVSGGTFVSEIPWAYCAPGYEPQAKGEGKYGVKDANIFIRDIKAAQRYPWNGYVDITLDVCWSTKATARLFIEAYENEGTAKPLSMESATMLDADGSEIAGSCAGGYEINAPTKKTIHLMWNSDVDGAVPSRVAEGVHFKFIAK